MNRRYLVDSTTREYLCVALQKGSDWTPNNEKFLPQFLDSRPEKDRPDFELLSGEYNDNSFFEKWIRNGTNYKLQG
ncbi:hypothetical protein HUW51_19420 [Adhaeribacter swui]|uniref:Uncharacterized protein n=1 Tax=Adhaeribacter swui TaxID=2086471 RepID=A0A7G7GCA6_9BACT|nr:hypothetical protein [Adhaeribacter swui]QNF34790.1 hypothetical protein HUW51_19420 [Adhaeribacter swui]